MTITATQRRQKRRIRSVVYLVLALIVFMSPVVVTHLKNMEQQRIAAQYSKDVARLSEQERLAALEEARVYNTQLPGLGAADPWQNGVDVTTPGYQRYLATLASASAMARLKVPSVGIDLPVYHGTSTDVLSHGIGHLYGTALPVGGEGTHSVLTGHTGLATLTMFDNLTHMRTGDVFTVEVFGETLAYEVDQIATVLPEEVSHIAPEPGKDFMTLVTCTPYGINSHRLLVRGHRVPVPPQQQEQRYSSPWQTWMLIAIGISIFIILYVLWWLWRQRRKDEQRENREA